MKVLLLNQTYYPDQAATAQQLRDLARHLLAEGCEVTVMTCRRSYSDPKRVYPAEEVIEGVRVIRVGSTGFGRRSFFHRFVDGVTFEIMLLLRLMFLRRQDVTIAFTSPPLIGFVALLFAALRGGKCVQWVMDLNPDIAYAVGYLKRTSLRGRILTAALRFSVRQSDHVVVLDRWMRQRLLAHGVQAERVIVVPPWPVNALSPADFDGGKRFRLRNGISEKFVILYSGNHSVAHPLDTLLRTALEMRDNPDVLFLFIGGGLREADVTRFRLAHGLTNIRQLPHQPREVLHESLSCADLHVVVMGEAMSGLVHVSKIYGVLATGAPYVFVGPRASHATDLISDCRYGYQVDHGDTQALKSVIANAAALTAEQKQALFENNTAFARDNCSVTRSLAGFLSQVIAVPEGPSRAYAPSRA